MKQCANIILNTNGTYEQYQNAYQQTRPVLNNGEVTGIKADLVFPEGRAICDIQGQKVLAYTTINPESSVNEVKCITRAIFLQISGGVEGFPPLVKIFERGSNRNVGFMFMWVTQDGMMHWKVGELLTNKTFGDINWKPFHQQPGRNNKGIGFMGEMYKQGIFEGSNRWVKFLEEKGYKLLFPDDEVVGNRLYMMNSKSPEMLTGTINIPKCMLAETFSIDMVSSGVPVIVEPKYDGCRHIATLSNGELRLYTRKRKSADKLKHIEVKLATVFIVMQQMLGDKTITCKYWLDGEMYRHGWSFQKVMSAVRRSVNQSILAPEIVYMVYDLIDEHLEEPQSPFGVRREFLAKVFADPRVQALPNIKLTQYWVWYDHSTLWQVPEKMEACGYEGAMVRTLDNIYMGHNSRRSRGLLKLKRFTDEEAWVMDVVSATGTHDGCAKYLLNTKQDGTGIPYGAVPCGTPGIGELESRRRQLSNKHLFIGCMVTVKLQGHSDENTPRFGNITAFDRDDLPV